MVQISCVIPAYNEAKRIGNILSAVLRHPLVNEIIVVDDGSADNTGEAAAKFERVRVITQKPNHGKSAAICAGVKASTGAFILMLDADLVGITQDDISRLLEPVRTGLADVSISLRGNAPRIFRAIGLDYISGERVLPKSLLADNLDAIASLPGFGLEVFLNSHIIRRRYKIAVVPWPNVQSPYKYSKYGFFTGLKSDLRMAKDIIKTVSIFGPAYQIFKMLRLKVT